MLKKQRQGRTNNTRNILVFLLTFFIIGIVFYIYYPTEKKRIRNVIEVSESAIQQEDIRKLMDNVSYNYRDGYGNSYLILKKRMQTVFRKFDWIEIEKNLQNISLNKETAVAGLIVHVTASEGDARGYIIGDAVDGANIRVSLEKSPYKWKVVSVDGLFDQDS